MPKIEKLAACIAGTTPAKLSSIEYAFLALHRKRDLDFRDSICKQRAGSPEGLRAKPLLGAVEHPRQYK
ncbi:hypothetical protein [Thalassotalea sediminis]|uniref:hypothetical protein n=1 Tax=Thalassotalea sediminis TaxID=1759089 RepID=UPI002572A2E4|nr:hypothetical protein [Thalassotalea sediminis]